MTDLTRDTLLYWGLAALTLAACFHLLRRFESRWYAGDAYDDLCARIDDGDEACEVCGTTRVALNEYGLCLVCQMQEDEQRWEDRERE